MSTPPDAGAALLTAAVTREADIFALRRSGRSVAQALGLENQDQVRFATVLSELGRDLLGAAGLTARFAIAGPAPMRLVVTLAWREGPGPSQESLETVARLLPGIAHRPGRVVIEQPLPPTTATAAELAARAVRLQKAQALSNPMEELRAQNRDLIAALEDSRARREELQRLNEELAETNQGVVALYSELSQELEDTNRGVVALYAEIDEKTRQLHEASEAKTRFWANVSHELRSPVNSVIGLARLLLDAGGEAPVAEQRHQLSLISASGTTLLALVDELLDVAKAESGRLEPHWGALDLRVLLGQLRGTMRGLASSAEVTLLIPDLPDAPETVSDEVMLTRILRNLLSNALKFTERGEVRLDVATEQMEQTEQPEQTAQAEQPGQADGAPWLLLTVSDTGVGIPEGERERIFEEFYQVRGPHQRGRAGTGLGLPYARRLAELLGGTLTVAGRPTGGTVFTLRLPTRPPAAVLPDPAAGQGNSAGQGGAVPRLTALVAVDDDPAFRAAVRPLLAGLADRVVQVSRGSEALGAVRREQPQAVLLDLYIADYDGYRVLDRLAADPHLHDIPVVVVTSARAADLDHARLAHARAVLDKSNLSVERIAAALALPPATPLPAGEAR
ncbi:ATP-binding response regulator [Kitasatospora mediocidica]|uniref:ATP-binding response regulator n=1 Tax=Kitasatospora mediocidica TaxID=58352 RepID=UPI00056291E5|nr:ATP-binding protein [Kitasatospora mediocidica]